MPRTILDFYKQKTTENPAYGKKVSLSAEDAAVRISVGWFWHIRDVARGKAFSARGTNPLLLVICPMLIPTYPLVLGGGGELLTGMLALPLALVALYAFRHFWTGDEKKELANGFLWGSRAFKLGMLVLMAALLTPLVPEMAGSSLGLSDTGWGVLALVLASLSAIFVVACAQKAYELADAFEKYMRDCSKACFSARHVLDHPSELGDKLLEQLFGQDEALFEALSPDVDAYTEMLEGAVLPWPWENVERALPDQICRVNQVFTDAAPGVVRLYEINRARWDAALPEGCTMLDFAWDCIQTPTPEELAEKRSAFLYGWLGKPSRDCEDRVVRGLHTGFHGLNSANSVKPGLARVTAMCDAFERGDYREFPLLAKERPAVERGEQSDWPEITPRQALARARQVQLHLGHLLSGAERVLHQDGETDEGDVAEQQALSAEDREAITAVRDQIAELKTRLAPLITGLEAQCSDELAAERRQQQAWLERVTQRDQPATGRHTHSVVGMGGGDGFETGGLQPVSRPQPPPPPAPTSATTTSSHSPAPDGTGGGVVLGLGPGEQGDNNG